MNAFLVIAFSLVMLLVLSAAVFYFLRRFQTRQTTPVYEPDNEFAVELAPVQPQTVPAPEPVPVEYYPLPFGYGDHRIVVMARDPYWLYTYWEINPSVMAEIAAGYGPDWSDNSPALRIYEAASGHSLFDIPLAHHDANWYINVNQPDQTYFVDYGFCLPDGRFITVVRSNLVTTPRDSISGNIDEEWLLVDHDALYARIMGHLRTGPSSAALITSPGLRAPGSGRFR